MNDDIGHLMLTRKVGDTITIGEDIELKISNVCGAAVTLSIYAPKSMPILRKGYNYVKKEEKNYNVLDI